MRSKVERHERRLLRGGRFVKRADGSVYDEWAGHGIAADLWRSWIEGLRYPRSRHRFVGDAQPIINPEYPSWPRRRAVCARCGDVRLMSFMVDPTTVRDGWCVR